MAALNDIQNPAGRITPPDRQAKNKAELPGVIAMSVPIVITLCSRMMMDITDFFMISRLPERSSDAQAAIMPTQVTLWTVIVLGLGTVSIVNTFVSQSLGRKKLRDAGAYAWQGVFLSLTFGAVATLSIRPLLPQIFALIGHPPHVQEMEMAYARVVILSMGLTLAAEALAAFFNGLHRPRVTMWSAIEANLLNVIISSMLIFGWFGMPAMGIAGAAWGTVIGVTYRFLRLLGVFLSRSYATEFATRSTFRFCREKTAAIIRVGMPQGLQSFSDVFVWMFFTNILIGRMFSETDLIASNVVWQYLRLAFMPTFGIGIALSAMVGKACGAGDPGLAIRVTRITIGIVVVYMVALSVIFFLFRTSLIAVFNPDPAVIAIGSSILICAVVFLTFDGIGIAYHAALKGAGDTLWPSILFIASHWLIVVGGGYLTATMKPEWGPVGPWSAAAVLLILLSAALWYRWQSRAWQRINLFEHESPAGRRRLNTDSTAGMHREHESASPAEPLTPVG